MSTKEGPVFTFSLPGSGSPPCPPVSYATSHKTGVSNTRAACGPPGDFVGPAMLFGIIYVI